MKRLWITGIGVITLLYVLAFAFNITPYLRGPGAWRWVYAIPGYPWRHLLPVIVVAAYIAIALRWAYKLPSLPSTNPQSPITNPSISQSSITRSPITKSSILFLLFIAFAVPIIQAALLFPESPDILRPLFYRTVSPGASGVFTVGSTIADPAEFLRRYPDLMPTFPVHPQRYPPGLPVLFYGTRRFFETVPAISDVLGSGLRLYQCHDFVLMRLPNATLTTALLQMALPLLAGVIVFPLYGLARGTIGQSGAVWAVILYPLVPSFALWSARWDQFYPVLTCAAWACFWRGLTLQQISESANRQITESAKRAIADHVSRFTHHGSRITFRVSRFTHHAWLFLGGLILSLASFLSFGPLAMVAPMGLSALLWVLSHPEHRRWGVLAVKALVFFAGLVLPWLIYQIAFGNGFPDIWRVSMAYHLGLARDYGVWLFYHLYDFFAFLGLPLALLFLAGLIMAMRGGWKDDRIALPLGFGLGLLLLDLSGIAQGEVARVWLFLTPFAVMGAAYGLSRLATRHRHGAVVVVSLAIQLLVFNAFLRVVTTGITDPPVFTRVPSTSSSIVLASFSEPTASGNQIELAAYDVVPDNVRPGSTVTVTLTWRAVEQVARPYTVFVHLLGPDGTLVAQHDGMPQLNNAPATCWRPGNLVPDPHPLTLPATAAPGDYTLVTGLYFLETNERLPAYGPTATPDNVVRVTSIHVKGNHP